MFEINFVEKYVDVEYVEKQVMFLKVVLFLCLVFFFFGSDSECLMLMDKGLKKDN